MAFWVVIQEFLKGLEVDWGKLKMKRGDSEETEFAASPGASEVANLGNYNKPLVPQAEPNFHKMMEKMTQFMGQLTHGDTLRNNFKGPEFKTSSMKAPDSFDGTQAHKMRGFTQSCKLIFHDDTENSFSEMREVLYSISLLTARAGE
ncbi:hypothetical protein O181_076526 [Austropuccinia psidii MF-1]|uniref:Uncharacterized protein n=1 Tax=Austropuccinia psidii MF-1 TaxID=1389203 RepID=A0A9Q3FGE1_9BASI|nr:hypothetical protein [Austropuccinia psidii MF-1]